MSPEEFLGQRLLYMVPLILSLSVHEWAHAWSAFQLGDDTAMRLGRMTMNPLVHIDPVGTVLLPLIGVPFGWAKPVPINPIRFKRRYSMTTGIIITAAAGPISNLVLAFVSCVLLGLVARYNPLLLQQKPVVMEVFYVLILLNILLATFNCLPIPPLDGSRIADGLMPRKWRPYWDQFCQLGPIALAAVIVVPLLTGFHLFLWPMIQVGRLIAWLTAPAGINNVMF